MKMYSIKNTPRELAASINKYNKVFGSLVSNMEVEVFEPGENIISFNKPIDRLRFMVQGRAKITFIHEDGKQSIVHFVKAGEYLGELTFLEIEKEHKNVTAISDSVFISIDMNLAKKILINDKKFLFGLSQFIGNKMLARTYFNSKNQNYELKNRLAAYILMSQNNGIYSEKHTETAEYLSISYRHLLYTFKGFITDGVVVKIKKGYRVDLTALGVLAKDIELT